MNLFIKVDDLYPFFLRHSQGLTRAGCRTALIIAADAYIRVVDEPLISLLHTFFSEVVGDKLDLVRRVEYLEICFPKLAGERTRLLLG